MGEEFIAYRRLYDALGAIPGDIDNLSGQGTLSHQIQYQYRITREPPLGVLRFKFPDDFVPVESFQPTPPTDQPPGPPPGFEAEPLLYTEILCGKWTVVPAETSFALHASEDQNTETLQRLLKPDLDDLKLFSDLLAGTIGLKGHSQFIQRLAIDHIVAWDRAKHVVSTASGPRQEVLALVPLSSSEDPRIKSAISHVTTNIDEQTRKNALILRWLLRAWQDKDEIHKFISLFVPLEMILKGQRQPRSQPDPNGKVLQRLIDQHGAAHKRELTQYLNMLKSRASHLSLEHLFKFYAESKQLPTWQRDVEAFGIYNKIRNEIVHAGQTNIHRALRDAQQNLLAFQDLTERYVSVHVYGDTQIYRSPHRPTNS